MSIPRKYSEGLFLDKRTLRRNSSGAQKELRRNEKQNGNLDRVWKLNPGRECFSRKIMKSLLAVRRSPEDGRKDPVEWIVNRIDGRLLNSSGKSSGAQKELRRKEKQNGNSSRVWKSDPGQKLFCRKIMKSLLAPRRSPEDGRKDPVEWIVNRIDGRLLNSSGKSSGAQKELRGNEKQNGNLDRVWKMNPGQKLFCRNL